MMILTGLAGGVFLWLYLRSSRQSDSSTGQRAEQARANKYAAVKIMPCDGACAAAERSAKLIYLAAEAPIFPLMGCDKADSCQCKFLHYSDRRQRPDRRDSHLVMSEGYHAKDKRSAQRQGRRAADSYG